MTEITSEDQWNERLAKSGESPFFVFKHSTTCPISARASDRVRGYEDGAAPDSPEIVMVKVIESRPISNLIAKQLGITHQSPQMILVKDSASVWDASHHFIQGESIEEAIASL